MGPKPNGGAEEIWAGGRAAAGGGRRVSWLDYLADRLPLLASFGLGLLFLLLVTQLGPSALGVGEVGYVLLLAAVFTAVILAVDFARQRRFRRAVARQLAAPARPHNTLAELPAPATREQRAFRQLLAARHRLYSDELRAYRDRAELHRAFVDQWVHQMKTPLSVLELTVQQTERDAPTLGEGELGPVWASMGEELERLAEGLDLMLTTSRLDRFDLDLRPARVELVSLARGVVNDLKRSWIRSNVYPRIEAPSEPVTVETDGKWLEVVIRQLLTNAIRYSAARRPPAPAGPAVDAARDAAPTGATSGVVAAGADAPLEVVIRVTRNAAHVTLSVEDRGIGIPAADLPRIFDRFFTGENGRRFRASTGMGLYLAAVICRGLGHPISAASEPGRGTTLSVRFDSRTLHDVTRP